MTLTAGERRTRARAGAYAQQAKHDTRVTTSAARASFLSRFEREVDPDNRLAPEERTRRAAAARKSYFAALQLQSAKSRRANSSRGGEVASRRAHNPETAGSSPAPATKVKRPVRA